MLFEQLFLLIVSFFANTLSAIAGGGAGLVQLPILIFLGLSFSTALATHKVATVALGVGATIKHSKDSRILLPLALSILCAGIPGVLMGAKTVLLIPEPAAKIILGIMTIALGLYSIFNKGLGLEVQTKSNAFSYHIIGCSVLFCIGFLNGAFSSGTGLFVTLWLITWYGCDYKRATAHTLIFVGLFWNSSGALLFSFLAEVKWEWIPALLLGSIAGGYVGATLSISKGNKPIKRLFEWVTLLVGVSLILHGLS